MGQCEHGTERQIGSFRSIRAEEALHKTFKFENLHSGFEWFNSSAQRSTRRCTRSMVYTRTDIDLETTSYRVSLFMSSEWRRCRWCMSSVHMHMRKCGKLYENMYTHIFYSFIYVYTYTCKQLTGAFACNRILSFKSITTRRVDWKLIDFIKVGERGGESEDRLMCSKCPISCLWVLVVGCRCSCSCVRVWAVRPSHEIVSVASKYIKHLYLH